MPCRNLSSPLFCLLTASLLSTGCSININGGYSFDYQGEQTSRSLDLEVPAELSSLNLRNVHGDVRLEASETGLAAVHWDLTCWADTVEEADRQAERIKLLTSQAGAEYNMEVQLPTEDIKQLRGVKSNFTIRLPSSVLAKIRNSHGTITAAQLDSVLNLHGSHGDMLVENVSQECTLSNAHGDLQATNIPRATIETSHGDATVSQIHEYLSVDSSHGSIDASNLTGETDLSTTFDRIDVRNVSGTLKVRNSHGDISGTQLNCSDVSAKTSFGNIEFASSAPKIECETSHGGINVTANGAQLDEVKLESTFNDITLYLPADCRPSIATDVSFGDVNSAFAGQTGGRPVIELDAQHGDINILKLPTAEMPK